MQIDGIDAHRPTSVANHPELTGHSSALQGSDGDAALLGGLVIRERLRKWPSYGG